MDETRAVLSDLELTEQLRLSREDVVRGDVPDADQLRAPLSQHRR